MFISHMRIPLVLMMACIFSFGCGGGDGSDSADSARYDLWDYLVSKTTITKIIDLYETDSNYKPTGEYELNAGQVIETVLSSDTVRYEEIINGTVVKTITFIVSSDTIQAAQDNTIAGGDNTIAGGDNTIAGGGKTIAGGDNTIAYGGNTIARYVYLGSSIGDCVVENHFDNYSPVSGYNYQDVIQTKCDTWSEFYAKGIGKVTGQNHWAIKIGENTTDYYSVGVANLN